MPLLAEHGRQYFVQVQSLLGSDPARARQLASRWKALADDPSTRPWAYRTKGVHERLQGKWIAAANSFQEAGIAAQNPAETLLFQMGAVDSLGRAGKVGMAVRLGNTLSNGLVELGRHHEAGLAMMNVANALMWHDRYKEARTAYRRSLELLDSSDLASVCSATVGLSSAELFGGDPMGARHHAVLARDGFLELGLTHFASDALLNIGHACLLTGRLDEALDAFLVAKRDHHSGLEAARIEEFLGDTFLRMNLTNEAIDAYESALASIDLRFSKLNQANVMFGLGSVHAADGNSIQARRWLLSASRGFKNFGNPVWHAATLILLARLSRQDGKLAQARDYASRAVNVLSRRRAVVWLAEAHLELADCLYLARRPTSAETRAAARIVERAGLLNMRWRVAHQLAREAKGKKKIDRYREMANSILETRNLVSSTVSRASYLHDKAEAYREYVGLLLEAGDEDSVTEALEAIRNARSVTLLEEILSATTKLGPKAIAELQAIREEVNSALGDDGSGGPARRVLTPDSSLARLQRRWIEVTRQARVELARPQDGTAFPDVVIVQSSRGFFTIRGSNADRLPIDQTDLSRLLKWIRFELLAPLTNPRADTNRLSGFLSELRCIIGSNSWPSRKGLVSICPDDAFWQLPWALVLDQDRVEEVVVSTGPWCGDCDESLPAEPRTMLWYAESDELPHVHVEAKAFLDRFPRSTVCQTVEEVRECLSGEPVDLLHVAAHAQFHPTNPMFSSLSLKGGRLTAAEIARSTLRPGIVVLSACETGTVSTANTSEPEGLVRSFLSRGATSVLASSWPLDDAAACLFMYNLYQGLVKGHRLLDCVGLARRTVRSEFRHPYFWGPLTLFGGYSR